MSDKHQICLNAGHSLRKHSKRHSWLVLDLIHAAFITKQRAMQLTEEIAEPEFLLADAINVSRITPPGNLNLSKVADILKTILRKFQRETLLRILDTPCFQEVRKI